jgi:N-acyl homoserine lactone hydrolase
MRTKGAPGLLLSMLICAAPLGGGCAQTRHPAEPAAIGVPVSSSAMEAQIDAPGPIEVETVVAADWEIDRGGLINLDHPKAKAAGLVDGPEPLQIYLHGLKHPRRGLWMIDTGIERDLHAAPGKAAIQGLVAAFMNLDAMKIRTDTATWIAGAGEPVRGVLLTHLHVDHVSGMRDVPVGTMLVTGPGEARDSKLENLALQPVIDRALAGKGPTRELRFAPDPDGRFEGVLDLFGDASLYAIHVPGHTAGTTAYLARTPKGPVLFVGDACHTRWGWENGVEPGKFSTDGPRSAVSLEKLRALAARHPRIDVRLGHQPMAPPQASR